MNHRVRMMNGYRYVESTFVYRSEREEIDKLIQKAEELADVVSIYGPNSQARSRDTRIAKNLGGLLAEYAFTDYVNTRIEGTGIEAQVEGSSEVRQSGIAGQEWDQVDITVRVRGQSKRVEVRSSFSYKTSMERLIGAKLIDGRGAFSIIGWYKHSHKPSEIKKDYYVLCVHKYHPTEVLTRCLNEVTVYILGAASKATLETKGYRDSLKEEGAEYVIINPLMSVTDPVGVVEELLGV